MSNIILLASLPLAVSANRLHGYNSKTGQTFTTNAARDYKEEVWSFLDTYPRLTKESKQKVAPFGVFELNREEVYRIRSLKGLKSRSKAFQSQLRRYSMSTLVVYKTESRDLDNHQKLFQDAISEWIGFNDRRISRIHNDRLVDPTVEPHVEVIVEEIDIQGWHSGSLINEGKTKLALQSMYDNPCVVEFLL